MGCYDFLKCTCPNCGKSCSSQTKLFGEDFTDLHIGSFVGGEDMDLQAKSACECGAQPVFVIRKGTIVAVKASEPTHIEGAFGTFMMTGVVLQEWENK